MRGGGQRSGSVHVSMGLCRGSSGSGPLSTVGGDPRPAAGGAGRGGQGDVGGEPPHDAQLLQTVTHPRCYGFVIGVLVVHNEGMFLQGQGESRGGEERVWQMQSTDCSQN